MRIQIKIKMYMLFLMIFPLASFAAAPGAATETGSLLNPDKLFEAIKKNITIPLPTGQQKVEIPKPEDALKNASPKLQEVNKDVKEETGIDLGKFISWMAKVLKLFFRFVVDILEAVANALNPKS